MTPDGFLGRFRGAALALAMALSPGLIAAGCGDEKGNIAEVGEPQILVSPENVTFFADGVPASSLVAVRNLGNGPLTITGYRWRENSGVFKDIGLDDLVGTKIPAETERGFTVEFDGSTTAIVESYLDLETNDRDRPRVTIAVSTAASGALILSNPPVVQMSSENIGVPLTVPVELYNAGNQPFDITALSLDVATTELVLDLNRDPADGPLLPKTITDSESLTINLVYTPQLGGLQEAQLLVRCTAVNCSDGLYAVPIRVQTNTPIIRVAPTQVAFGTVPTGSTESRSVTISNEGQSDLRISNIDFALRIGGNPPTPEFKLAELDGAAFDRASQFPLIIPPGSSKELKLTYSPTNFDNDSERVLISSNDPIQPQLYIPIGGTVAAPRLEVSPERIDFPLVARGLSADRILTIRNGGTEPLNLGALAWGPAGDNSGVFEIVNLAAMPTTLAGGDAFNVILRFKPTSNSQFGTTLRVTGTNLPAGVNPDKIVPITGRGDTDPRCELWSFPALLNFGVVPRGVRREMTATIENRGSGPCRVGQIQKAQASGGGLPFPFPGFQNDAYFELVGVQSPPGQPSFPAAFEVGPGQSFSVTVSYFPRSLGLVEGTPDSGLITISATNATTNTPATCRPPQGNNLCGFKLEARAAIAEIAVIPSRVDFGLVTIGCNSQSQDVRVYNTGSADVRVTDVFLTRDPSDPNRPPCSNEFQIAGVPPMPRTMQAGQVFNVSMRYRPDATGADQCFLVVQGDAENNQLVVPVTGEGTEFSTTRDDFTQVSGRKVDVLFVIDNSGSMGEEQSNLSRNFGSFIAAARAWGTEFQIGIVTTQTEVGGGIQGEIPGGRLPGELIGNPRILTPRTPSFDSVFQSNARVGTNGSGTERGLESARLALSDPQITDLSVPCSDAACTTQGSPYACHPSADGAQGCGGYNRTFVREDASLEIIFVSDEEDSSIATTDFFVDFFKNIKGFRNEALFHASAIVGPPGGCTSSAGDATAGLAYIDVARRTNGEVASICDSSFATSLANIGNRAFGLRVQFFLSRSADPSTIQVYRNGQPATGWTYDAESNTIIWEENSVPGPNETFDVRYEAACF